MINQLLNWLDASTSNVLATQTIADELRKAGFTPLDPAKHWDIHPAGRYYVTKNDTAIFAFIAGNGNPADHGFHIISSHSDSPCFKIKPNPEIYCEGGLVKLNVEKYGGGILYTWFDRPLSLSGRVTLRSSDPLNPDIRPLDLRQPIAFIPHLAIHFNRAVNEGNHLSVQKDMLPIVGIFTPEEIEQQKANGGIVKTLIARHLGCSTTDILDYELCLYPTEKAALAGINQEFFQSGRIDDLSMAFASLRALLDTADTPTQATRIIAVFDNEETGSGTKQGAASPVLANILRRITAALSPDHDDETFLRSLANTFMISADDAHAWHPNYNDKFDPTNHALIGHGPAVKINANCKYMTDADGAAVFRSLCQKAGVNMQYFVNHSDVAGGSTLGNILTSQIDIRGVDMGAPIWAMHSARETASVADHISTIKTFSQFFLL